MTIEEIEAARPDYQKHLDNLNQRLEELKEGKFAPQSIGFRDYESARLHFIGEIDKAEDTLRKIDQALQAAYLPAEEEDEVSV
ncbi:MAG: hypothetical protein KDK38_08215 [Leptospiraceae bacterium]|nr:hypothetical protein [Leptospiraceae bacterium]